MKSIRIPLVLAILLTNPVAVQAQGKVTLEVQVRGVEGDLLRNVLLTLGVEKRKNSPFLTPALIRSLHRRAPDEIRAALEPYGYYRPRIQADLESETGKWRAVYIIDPGDPVHIRRITLEVTGTGKGQPGVDEILKRFTVEEGNVLVHSVYEESKRLLLNLLNQDGYLDATYPVKEVTVDPEAGTADIMLQLDTGPRFHFGPVTFYQDFLDERYLHGFVTIERGQPFTMAALLDLENALTDTRQFSLVDVRAPKEEADGLEIPVLVHLTPGPSQKFTVGLGYGTDTGARGSAGWEHRRVNRKGQGLKTDLRVSEVNQEITVKYVVPLAHPRTDRLDYSLGRFRERVEDVDSETYLLGASLSRSKGWFQETLFLNFEREDFTVGGDTGTTILLIPGVSWTRVVADDRIRTSRGYTGILELKGASKDLVSDVSFLQATFYLKGIMSLTESLRLLARTELGTSWVDEFSELPSSQRFFTGGDRSVRGYAYKSLGPKDSNGDVIGGEHLVVGSVELEYYLSRNWSLAGFFDAGNSLDDLSEPLEQGAGIGVRWHTLIGPIRLDFAQAITEDDKPWRIHLNIGPDL